MNDIWETASTVWRLFDRRDHLLVLSLHRIDLPHGLPAATVKESLKFLRANNYRFVLPEELLRTGVKGRMAMLTVDDGHREVYTTLYPLARALGIPVVVCMTANFFLHNRWLWFDKLRWLLAQLGTTQPLHAAGLPEEFRFPEARMRLNKYLKTLSADKREKLIHEIATNNRIEIPSAPTDLFRPIAKNNMTEMLESGLVELAAHTLTHPIMTMLSSDELDFELRQSKKELEEFSGREIRAFCYPNGLPGDFDERTRSALEKTGYDLAFTSAEGINYIKNVDWRQLNRIHIHRDIPIFKRSTSGLGHIISQIKG